MKLGERLRSEHGTSTVEYAILVSAVAAAVVLVIGGLGLVTSSSYDQSCARLSAKLGGNCSGAEDPAQTP